MINIISTLFILENQLMELNLEYMEGKRVTLLLILLPEDSIQKLFKDKQISLVAVKD